MVATVNLIKSLAICIAAYVCLSLATDTAKAQQNLTVRPVEAQFSMLPGRTGRLAISISNSHPTRTETLQIAVTDLRQSASGQWRIAETGTDGSRDTLPAPSASEWLTLPDDTISVAPESTRDLMLEIETPHRARGVYFAGITLLTEAPEAPEADGRQAAFLMRYRFLIPIIIEIDGRSVRQKISINDVGMGFVQESERFDAPTTVATVEIANDGRSFPEVGGRLLVERKTTSGDWRRVTRLELPKRQLAPKNTIRVSQDLDRRLPSGTYRLRADARVDGRRIAPLTETLQFKGDPSIDRVAYDTRLKTEPDVVSFDVRPGSVRANTIVMRNPGTRPVTVETRIRTPEALRGVAMGDLRGEALSAAKWLSARPETVELRPRQRRRVRIMARVPRDREPRAHQYAKAVMTATYADGQTAGQTEALVHLTADGKEVDGRARFARLSIDETSGDDGAYAVSAGLRNVSTVHVEPSVRMRLLDPDGEERRSARFDGDEGWLLPMEGREYSGVLETADLDAGRYTLLLEAETPNGRVARRQADIRVVDAARAPDDTSDFEGYVLLSGRKAGAGDGN